MTATTAPSEVDHKLRQELIIVPRNAIFTHISVLRLESEVLVNHHVQTQGPQAPIIVALDRVVQVHGVITRHQSQV